jgi:carbonic anhydrase/acetyltransferase-like protein (isoleucine patch superfamily)
MPLYSIGDQQVVLRGAHHYIAHDATLVGAITLEADANIWFKVVIRAENDVVTIGEATNVQDGSVLHVDPGFPLTLGKRVTIGHKVMLHGCTIGEATNVQDGSVLHVDPGFPLTLGKRVTIGHKMMLHGCTIGDGSLVGINSVVMNGARVGQGTLIGANTLIAEGKEIPDGVLVLGSPGKIVRQLKPEERVALLKVADGYVERSRRYKAEFREQPLPPSAR